VIRVSLRTKWLAGTLLAILFVAAVWTLAVVTNESSPPSRVAHITIHDYMFSPMKLVVQPGEHIVVKNDDSVVHTLTSIDDRFASGLLAPGYSDTIEAPSTPGTYDYICTIHRYMFGEIIVK